MARAASADRHSPIALFDSGVGGLSVLRQLEALLPFEDYIYLADQAHVPYGQRSEEEIRIFSQAISAFLLDLGAKIVVVACNTASAAALDYLRDQFPGTSFVGMEPAVKPGAHQTQSGKIGVLATPGTFDSRRYALLMARFAGDIEVFEDPCHGLVELIEAGQLGSPQSEEILERAIVPMVQAGVDTLVLGCTHYPFLLTLIQELAGPDIAVIDPAPAVALQVKRVLESEELLTEEEAGGSTRVFTTAEPAPFASMLEKLLGKNYPITALHWSDDYQILL